MADPWKVARDDKLGPIYWLMSVIVNMNDQMHLTMLGRRIAKRWVDTRKINKMGGLNEIEIIMQTH